MSNLKITQAINGDFQNLLKLAESLHLELNRGHGDLNSLIQLNYSQTDSPKNDPIASECRGLILDVNTMQVVCRGFNRFFNVGQNEAAPIDWLTAKFQEKLDGSLILVYWYNNRWNFATRGFVGASGNVGTNEYSFNEFVQNIWAQNEYYIEMNTDYTYLFELISPENKIVCSYTKRELVLLAAINKEDGTELDIETIDTNIRKVSVLNIRSFEEATKALENASPMDTEGFVVVDDKFNRVKIKSPKYLIYHRMRSKSTPRGILELIKADEAAEFVNYFPEFKNQVHEMLLRIDALEAELSLSYSQIKHIDLQKEFALQAVKSKYSAPLFALRSNKVKSIREFLMKNTTNDHLLEKIGY